MMNHIAVVLRGHIRTWNIIHKDVFEFYKSLAHNVDYYFVTWFLPNFDFRPIKKTFAGENLVNFILLPKTQVYYTSWYGPSFMTYMTRPYIEQRLKEVQYDAIFESRPDVAVKLLDKHCVRLPEKNKLYVSNIEIQQSYLKSKSTIALSDFWFMSQYDVYKKMSERFITKPINGNQIDYRLYAEKENIGIDTLFNSVEAILARPNCSHLKGKIKERFYELYQLNMDWYHLSSEEKIKICYKENIHVVDYQTDCALCKI